MFDINIHSHDENDFGLIRENLVSNNVFLNSAAVPDVSCNPIEDYEDEFEAYDIKDRSEMIKI